MKKTKQFSELAAEYGYANAANILAGKLSLNYDVFRDPSGFYYADNKGIIGDPCRYVGSRCEWVATFTCPNEASEYAAFLNEDNQ